MIQARVCIFIYVIFRLFFLIDYCKILDIFPCAVNPAAFLYHV